MPRDPSMKMAPEAAGTASRAGSVAFGKPTTPYNVKTSLGTIWEGRHGGQLVRFEVAEFNGNRYAALMRLRQTADGWRYLKGGTMPLWGLAELHAALGDYLARNAPGGAPVDS